MEFPHGPAPSVGIFRGLKNMLTRGKEKVFSFFERFDPDAEKLKEFRGHSMFSNDDNRDSIRGRGFFGGGAR